jgi:hypothetical protein
LEGKYVNGSARNGDMFLAADLTELSGAVTEAENVAVITEAVFKLLQNNINITS